MLLNDRLQKRRLSERRETVAVDPEHSCERSRLRVSNGEADAAGSSWPEQTPTIVRLTEVPRDGNAGDPYRYSCHIGQRGRLPRAGLADNALKQQLVG